MCRKSKFFVPAALSFLFSLVALQKAHAQITSVTVSPKPACAGTNLTVTFSSSAAGSKVYNAFLSTATGSFGAPIASASDTFSAPTNAILTLAIPSTASGSKFKVMITTSGVNPDFSSSFTIIAASVGGNVNGSTTECSEINSGTLTLSGQTGNVLRWESSIDGGSNWSTISNTTTSQTYTNLTQTTMYRAVVQNSSCVSAYSSVATVTRTAPSVGGTLSPEVLSVCTGSSGTIQLSGETGSIVKWQYSTNGTTSWTDISNTTNSLTYTNLTQSTIYRAVVQNGGCAAATSDQAVRSVKWSFAPTATAYPTVMCLGESSTFTATSDTLSVAAFDGGLFDQANPKGWRVTESGTGEIIFPANADNANNNPWSETNGPKTFNGVLYNNSPLSGKFAVATGWDSTTLETPIFSTLNMTSAAFEFYTAYNLNAGCVAKTEISVDGGLTYHTLSRVTGPASYGTPNKGFQLYSIPLTDYLNHPNVRLRFTFMGTGGSNWAIDNVSVTGSYLPGYDLWTPSAYLSSDTGHTVTATPTVPGTYTYTVYGMVDGCPGGSANVTIVVKPPPNAVASRPAQSTCTGTAILPVSFSGSVPSTTFNWTRDNVTNVTGIASSGSGTITGTLTNTTSVSQTVTFTVTPIANGCPGTPINCTITVRPTPKAVLSGSDIKCNAQSATLTITVTGDSGSTVTGKLSNGTTFSGVTPTVLVNVNPSVTTTYTLLTLTGTTCAISPSNLSGSATITCLSGPAGLWTGAVDKDWFNCRNWANGKVPTLTVNVTIDQTASKPCEIDATISPYAAAYNYIAQCKNINVSNNSLTFIATSDTLTAAGNVTITNDGVINMTAGGKIELWGNWDDQVSTIGKGFIDGTGTVIFSGSATQTISASKSEELFYNLEINKPTTTGLVGLNKNITVENDLILYQGIFVTGYHLFTWNNTGVLVAPESTYTPGSINYTKSFIATCDMSGNPINVANATTPFNGDAGFRIKNVINTNTYFPVGASFLPSATGEPPAPNRMMINNASGTPNDFTVALNYGDIGFTNAPVVERIWYVKSDATQATMQLFFTKRDITGWAGDENEVEGGFNYFQAALIQKDYNRNVLNLSAGADIQDFVNSLLYPYNTEIYGLYRIGVSNNLTNGIQQFNRFSIVNPFNLILPVTIVNFNAYKTGPRVKLEWTVADEINIDHYEAERSANGVNFSVLGRISAFNHGSSINYSKVDSFPLRGNNFYRIKAIDRDGTLKYTSIVSVNFEKAKTSMIIYPNPVRSRIINMQLDNLPNGKYRVLIYNNLGQNVFSSSIEHTGGLMNRSWILPLNIKPGIYIIKLFNERMNFIKSVIVE